MRGGGARLGGSRGGGFFRGARPHGREWRPGRPAGYVVQWPMIFAIPDEDGAGAPYSYCLEGLDSDPYCAATYAGDERPSMSPMQQRIHIAGNIFVTLSRSPEGVWSAETEIQTKGGPIVISARADERVIRKSIGRLNRNQLFRLVHRAIHALPAEAREDEMVSGDIAGGFFDDIGDFFTKTIPKAVKTVTKSKVFQDVAKGISDVANNPIVQGAMSIIPGGGLINQGMKHAGAAASLLARGKGGDQLAKQGIQAIANAAAEGNPKAKKALALMQKMNANPLAFMPPGAGGGTTAAGWDPYRRPGSRAAQNLMRRALQGDTRAQGAVQQIARRADLGDFRAREAAATLAAIAQQNAATTAAANAAAWAASNPYQAPEVNPYGNPYANYAPAAYPPSYVAPYGYPATSWATVSVSGDPGPSYPKCGQHFASGDDFPRPGPVDPAAYARMVKVYEAAGGDFFRRRAGRKGLHPLRGHSMHYGLPLRFT